MKYLHFLLLLAAPSAFFSGARASNSDSVNVLHYNIHLDTLDMVVDTLAAHTEVIVTPRVANLNVYSLDLLGLNVDSVQVNGAPATFSYNDTLLVVHSPAAYQPGDSVRLMVWYNGVPQMDASSWGGFYLNNALYAYNLGVGFEADPHNFGRVWFPCKDNFTDKATFDFWVETIPTRTAVCNGTLQSTTTGGDGNKTWHWSLRDPIATYLASVAVSDYVAVRDTLFSISGDSIPIAIYVRAGDSTDAVGSFQNLQATLAVYENRFGAYPFERVGYVAVPFNSGAMEHATNIAYPAATLLGTTAYEDLWGHELSHMWFGDLVTCETAEDMWLNEGWASYCEAVQQEGLYGTQAYKNYLRNVLATVLRTAHYDDGGYRAVSGVPHAYTYGTTVYKKGSLVVHSLRHYLGDSGFFQGVQSYLQAHSWANASSDTLKNELESATGTSLTDFFDAWVYSQGFTHFSVDSFGVTGSGPFSVEVHLRQRIKAAPALYNSNRVWITFLDANRNQNTQLFAFSGASDSQVFSVPFEPVAVMVDLEEKIADATTDSYLNLSATGQVVYPNSFFTVNVQSVTDTSFLRITHNWVAPDSFSIPFDGMELNNVRYWRVEGNFPPGFHAKGIFNYNGSASYYLDSPWFTNREDSTLIFWRPGAGHEWQLVDGFVRNIGGSPNDKIGSIAVDTLWPGEYALGQYLNYTSAGQVRRNLNFVAFPNPASEELTIETPGGEGYFLRLVDESGMLVMQAKVSEGKTTHQLNVRFLPDGVYLLQLKGKHNRTGSTRIVIGE